MSGRWLAWRVAYGALLVGVVITLVFGLTETATHPPTETDADGIERPLACLADARAPAPQRYLTALATAGMAGPSWRKPDCPPVARAFAEALPSTAALSGAAILIAWPLALMVGAAQATRAGGRVDAALTSAAVALHAAPALLLALGMQLAAPAVGLRSVPARGDGLVSLTLPVATLVILLATGWVRTVRVAFIEALAQPHVQAARLRGLPERRVLWRHVLPHALRPVIALAGLSVPRMLAGSVIIEAIFARPGMGMLLVQAARSGDAPTLVAGSAVAAVAVVLGDLLATLANAALDPRAATP
ncbi:MAG TPA: ABC transporter permease [Myxococcota bacterium]|nr:ABC transporter permease [Myxococcota bacterium]